MPESPILAAGAVIVDEAGRILLVLRGRDPGRGLWSVPGGKAEPGESLRETAAREVLEETGLTVTVGRELWTVRAAAGEGHEYEIHDHEALVIGGTLCAGDDADQAAWFTPEEVRELVLVDGLRQLLRGAGFTDA